MCESAMPLEEIIHLMKISIVFKGGCIHSILPSHENLVHMITLFYLLKPSKVNATDPKSQFCLY